MSSEAIDLLRSIDASLKQLVQQSKARQASQPKPVADDRDLDGKYGNPLIKFKPRDWTGPSFKDRRMSECPAEFLEMAAKSYDWFAEQAEKNNERTNSGRPAADYKRADAARARGWAKRIRDGRHTPAVAAQQPPPANGWGDDTEHEWAQ